MVEKKSVSDIDQALAAVLKGAYKTRGLTQEELVERTGITTTTMQRLMAGKTAFDIKQLFDIADAIGWKSAQAYLSEAEDLRSPKTLSAATGNVTPIKPKGDEWQGEDHALQHWDAAAKNSDTVIEIQPDDVTP